LSLSWSLSALHSLELKPDLMVVLAVPDLLASGRRELGVLAESQSVVLGDRGQGGRSSIDLMTSESLTPNRPKTKTCRKLNCAVVAASGRCPEKIT
jgi:hypothetical protein